jgi:hypothetical protein
MEKRVPNLKKIIMTDYFAMMIFAIIIVASFFIILVTLKGKIPDIRPYLSQGRGIVNYIKDINYSNKAILLSIIVGIPVLIFRVNRIKSLFKSGVEVKGKVLRSRLSTIARGSTKFIIEFKYNYHGQDYETETTLAFTNRKGRLVQSGQDITVLVDNNNPKKAIIKDLYM